MAKTESATVSDTGRELSSQSGTNYVRWGGLAAMLGPLLLLVANSYGVWRTFGPGPDGVVKAAMTTPYLVFGSARLLGAIVFVFGLIALYRCQREAIGKLGAVGYVLGMSATILLAGSAWFQLFIVPGMAAEAPAFTEAARTAQAGQWLLIGNFLPVLAQLVGFVLFGIATYRARVFPRSAAVVLVIGTLLTFVPVHFVSPTVFLLAIMWLGYFLFSGRLESPAA